MRHLLAICAFATVAEALGAQQPCTGTNATTSGYCYAAALIDALGTAHVAALTKPDTAGVSGNFVGLATEMLYVSGRQRKGIDEAVRSLSRYATSRDPSIQLSASSVVDALRMLHQTSLAMDSSLRDMLDQRAGSQSKQAQRLADLRNQRHDGAKLLTLATIAATDALLEPDPSDTSRMRLSLRAAERTHLLALIGTNFAGMLEPASGTGQYASDYAGAVQFLDKFLRDKWPNRP